MLNIDGSRGEGGGQILRTALALSLVTGAPFRLTAIRGKRAKPGLLRQHLAAVRAAEAIGASVEGAELGASEITVRPGPVRGGEHTFAIGSAGSATLVVQTVLPALLAAGASARLRIEGGTHNPFAPPYDFLERVFLPVLARMGADVRVRLERCGFYPAGGGAFEVEVAPGARLAPIELAERGTPLRRRARAMLAHLRGEVAKRELAVVREELGWEEHELEIAQRNDSAGPGNVLLLEWECEHATELCTAFGERGVSAERVARTAIGQLRRYLACDAPVGEALADQLIVPFALAGGGAFRTLALTEHSRTNLEIVRAFVPVRVELRETEAGTDVRFAAGA
jgi:RNA 3'-terminal phosphate cyclase (ATP)